MSKKKNFEAAFQRLEEIARLMENGDTPLEESVKLYEEGCELIRFCADKLNGAETKIRKLSKSLEGTFSSSDFDSDAVE